MAGQKPVTVYRLLRAVLLHILHGGGRDEVGIAVNWDTADGEDFVCGDVRDFNWGGGLFSIDAFTDRPEHYTAPRVGLHHMPAPHAGTATNRTVPSRQ
jgi:hypothetical protein